MFEDTPSIVQNSAPDLNTIGVWVTAAATLALALVAWVQLQAIRRTSRADFVHRLNADFFNDEARHFIRILERDEIGFFVIDDKGYFILDGRHQFDAFDLDSALLGPLESIAAFEAKGVVGIDLVYDMFSWYVITLWEKPVIRDYVHWVRGGPEGWDIYDGLEHLYSKCKAYGDMKRRSGQTWICETN